ncbi:MAG: trypsin-like serine protease [Henriciella sp.]
MNSRKAEFKFRREDGSHHERTDAIFPIVTGKSLEELRLVGTGFYISQNGIFVSARDCFEDREGSIDSSETFQAIHLAEDDTYMFRPITWGWHSNHADVSVCVAAPMTNNKTGKPLLNSSLTLTAERPPIGTDVCTYAFGKSKISRQSGKTEISLRPAGYDGQLIRYYPTGRDKHSIPWACYETGVEINAGASGGPVFNLERGTVFAVNTSSMEGDESVSFVTPIDFIFDAEFEHVQDENGHRLPRGIRELSELGLISFSPPLAKR